jgi:LysR family transcriptional activator of nhaA
VAREGGVTRASERLHLAPQTISGQLSLLEDYPGLDLSSRGARKLERTDTGGMVLGYAYEIVSLGAELEEVIHQRILMPALQTDVGARACDLPRGGS